MSRYADELRSLALSFPEAYEDEPWGHPVFKVGDNRMFELKARLHAPLRPAGTKP